MQLVTFKVELDIAASKVLHQLQTHNHELEEATKRGIEAAFKELAEDTNWEQLVKEKVKDQFIWMLNREIATSEVAAQVRTAINKAVTNKIEAYAEKVAEKFTSALE
jgi:hypothetical protein